jgi:glutathione S-transferase
LREKQLSFDTSISMMGPGIGATDAMRAYTPTGTAPVLQHGSFWTAESTAIVEYLEKVFPPPAWPRLIPADVRARARARELSSWLRTSLAALRKERPMEAVFYPAMKLLPLSPTARQQADELVRVAERLHAGASGCLFGGSFCAADVDLALALMRLIGTGTAVAAPIAAYAEAVFARPSVREFAQHPRPPHPPEMG